VEITKAVIKLPDSKDLFDSLDQTSKSSEANKLKAKALKLNYKAVNEMYV
jgi:hypothetical protein